MPIDNLSALLWDMDGTLVDTEPLWVECEADLMRRFDYEWGEEDARFCIGGPMEKVERYMCEKSGSDLPLSWFGDQLVAMMLLRLRSGIGLMPGVSELISEARGLGVKMALVSASRREIVDAVLEGIGIEFDISISASDVERSKPDPEGYMTAAMRLETGLDRCVIFEDSPVGIMSGIASGALTIGVSQEVVEHRNFISLGSLNGRSLAEIVRLHQGWFQTTEAALQ